MAGTHSLRFGILFAALASLAIGPVTLAVDPGEIPGLEAWYKIDSLHDRLKDGAEVYTWEDSTPNRHDLVFDEKSPPATFNTVVLNGMPVVQIGKANVFKVSKPFDLNDHTIFLVYSTRSTERALFRSDRNNNRGVMLFNNGQSHQYRSGHGRVTSYNTPKRLKTGYSITVLGRDAGAMTAFIDGVDHSSLSKYEEPIRVGVFFQLGLTTFIARDGNGLNLAEMLFFSRYLDHSERKSVTEYLSEKYAIPVQITPADLEVMKESDVRVLLTSSSPTNLNDDLVPVEWNAQEQIGAPFSIDLENDNTAIICDRDGTLARVSIKLPLVAKVEDVGLRLLILKSAESYHPEESATTRFEASGGSWHTTLELDTTIKLDAGDYIEIITSRTGGEGIVVVEPGAAELVIAIAD